MFGMQKLCAYKKWRLGVNDPSRKTTSHYRYPGYYLDRQHDEIVKLQNAVKFGVDWDVLWQYRKETYDITYLKEFGADNFTHGIELLNVRLDLYNSKGVIL